MITIEDIQKFLIKGNVLYIMRASLVGRPDVTGYYVSTSNEIHDFFIRDEGTPSDFTHSASKILYYNHPYQHRILYVLPKHVVYDSLGLKI